jgi:NDP-sugar pyrophosphorylase family protein
MVEYKVLITTSGVGSRLGDLTKYTNKCLVRVGKKPAISYIVEAYPKEVELVVTVGYFGEQVKDFLTLAYPERKITFIEVDKYEGEGSSLGYSMLKAKDELRCPFIFHAADTIITEETAYIYNDYFVGDKNTYEYVE